MPIPTKIPRVSERYYADLHATALTLWKLGYDVSYAAANNFHDPKKNDEASGHWYDTDALSFVDLADVGHDLHLLGNCMFRLLDRYYEADLQAIKAPRHSFRDESLEREELFNRVKQVFDGEAWRIASTTMVLESVQRNQQWTRRLDEALCDAEFILDNLRIDMKEKISSEEVEIPRYKRV